MTGGGEALSLRGRGFLADTRTAALVAVDGMIDWYCPGRYDADADLFRLLDPAGGAVRVAPAGPPAPGEQSYLPGTNVLRTVLHGREAAVEVVDLLPWEGPGHTPPGRIVRLVRALRGPVDVAVEVAPGARFRSAAEVSRWSEGLAFDRLVVRTGTVFRDWSASLRLDAGERAVVTIDLAGDRRHRPLSVDAACALLTSTAGAWRRALAPLAYDGPHAPAVLRSLLVLAGLTYQPTGALVGAATTSLPRDERSGLTRDSRLAWTVDSARVLQVHRRCGLTEAAALSAGWLQRVMAAVDPQLPGALTVTAEAPPGEAVLPLAGWRRLQPVRTGRGPEGDGWSVAAAGPLAGSLDGELFARLEPRLRRLAGWLADDWARPDRGVWEVRGRPRQFVSSRLSARWALDRLGRLAVARNPLDLDAVGWRMARQDVDGWLETHAVTSTGRLRSTPSASNPVDASLLWATRSGPWPADHPVVVATIDAVLGRLGSGAFVAAAGDDLDDASPPARSASLAASFRAVEALALARRWDEAHARMDELVAAVAPLGLLPDALDPSTRSYLGDLPSAAAAVALVEAALALAAGPR